MREVKVGMPCNMHGKMRSAYKILFVKSEGK
jgi:hypothetical protein